MGGAGSSGAGSSGGGPYTCDLPPGPGTSGSGGSSGSSSGSGTTGPVSCDANPGVCEPAQDQGDSPCCDDVDCQCATGECQLQPCLADGYCDCRCPSDPDCVAGACGEPIMEVPQVGAECPASMDPVVLYMSNDDSNSMASAAFARRSINEGLIVDPFQIHEFLNYYDLSYDNPTNVPAKVGMQMRRLEQDSGEFVLLLNAQGRVFGPEVRRPLNLVFSADTSGSMGGEPIALLRDTMRAVAGSLLPGDVVSVVEWSEAQTVLLEAHEVTGANDAALLALIDGIESGGGTDLHGGLVRAYQLANANYSKDRINRVILLSDGGANLGITDVDLIAAAANDADKEGIYLLGVGVSEAAGYRDDLMDDLTDAGKGAYVFIDSAAEANKIFGERFLQTVEVAARNVRMEVTLPWYFGIKEFHGEEYSEDPEEVEPQHLAPNDAMSYHQIVGACDPSLILSNDTVKAKVTFEAPITREALSDEMELTLTDLVHKGPDRQLYKSDVIVAYAQALIVTGDLYRNGFRADAVTVAQGMAGWLDQAAQTLGDAEVAEMQALMEKYVIVAGG